LPTDVLFERKGKVRGREGKGGKVRGKEGKEREREGRQEGEGRGLVPPNDLFARRP